MLCVYVCVCVCVFASVYILTFQDHHLYARIIPDPFRIVFHLFPFISITALRGKYYITRSTLQRSKLSVGEINCVQNYDSNTD